jgi:hypothetical protein
VLGRVEEEQKVQGWDQVRSQPDEDGDSECLVGLELHWKEREPEYQNCEDNYNVNIKYRDYEYNYNKIKGSMGARLLASNMNGPECQAIM